MKNFFKKRLINKKDNNLSVAGKCPKCGGELIEQNDYYSCINIISNTCTFRIPLNINGTKVDIKILDNIKEFEAVHSAVLKAQSKNPKENIESRKILHLPCGNCGSQIIKKDDYAICTNEKCGLKASSKFKNIKFEDYELAELMCRGVSSTYNFYQAGQSKKCFVASVVLDIDENLKLTNKYKFIRNMEHIEDIYLDNYYQYYYDDYSDYSNPQKMNLRERIKEDIRINHFY